MAEAEPVFWGVRAGVASQAESLFLKQNFVALDWPKVGDLGAIKADRDAFKAKETEAYPDKKPGAIANHAGQLFRFVHEMKIGDLAVYPSKIYRQVHIGRIAGAYQYDPSKDHYRNLRAFKWLRSIPRTQFSQGALYEIGSALTLFQIKTYVDEFRAALEGKLKPLAPAIEDDTVAIVAKDIEENTRDFILKRLAQELKGHSLAEFVAQLLGTIGYRCRVSPKGPDQ